MPFSTPRFTRRLIGFGILCLLAQHGWAGDETAALRQIVDAQIVPMMAEHEVPGVAVAVIIDGKTRFFNYGLATLEGHVPVSENTLFEIGSVSKTFAATLASYAQVTGKLAFDDHPGKTLPQLRGSAIDTASLLNLGTFTAGGLPLQFPDEVGDDVSMMRYYREWKPEAAPGVIRRYSNTSIGLLGYIAAQALNGEYAELMEKQLFPELGMQHSYVHVPEAAMSAYAWGYRKGRPVRVNRGQLDAQTYGVKSSASDMIRFVAANIDPSQLRAPLRHAIEGTHVGYFQTGEMVQGLGWEQYPYPLTLATLQMSSSSTMSMQSNVTRQLSPPRVPPSATLFNKTGSTNGFAAYVVYVPSKKIGIVMLANKNFPIPARVSAVYSILQQAIPGAVPGN